MLYGYRIVGLVVRKVAKSTALKVTIYKNELDKSIALIMIEGILRLVVVLCFLLSAKNAAGVDICWNENLILRCDSDHDLLLIGDSYYGRLEISSRCLTDSLRPIGCAVNVAPLLAPLCSGRRSCNVTNVKDLLAKVNTCRGDLQSYLELDYKCVRATTPSIPCADGHVIVHTPTSASGRLTSLDSHCAWLIQSAPGLRINLTLEDVLPQEPCLDIARVTERSEGGAGVVLRSCGVGNRERSSVLHYASKGNEVKVEMVAQGDRVYERFFVIDYKIFGCAYPSLPRDVIVVDRRWSDGSGAIWIQCKNDETMRTVLICSGPHNGVWTGNVSLTCPASVNEVDRVSTETWIPIGVTLLITTGIAILVCFVIVGSGLFCLYRRKRHHRRDVLLRPIRPNPAHNYATPTVYDTPQSLKFHTLPVAQLHRHYASTLPHFQRPVCPVRPTGFSGGRPPMPVPVPRVPELTPSKTKCTCTHENPPRGRGKALDSDQSAFSGRGRDVGTGQSDYASLAAFSTFKPELESPYEDPNENWFNLEPLSNKQ